MPSLEQSITIFLTEELSDDEFFYVTSRIDDVIDSILDDVDFSRAKHECDQAEKDAAFAYYLRYGSFPDD